MYIYLGATEIVFMSIYLNEKNRKNIMRIPSWVTQVPKGWIRTRLHYDYN